MAGAGARRSALVPLASAFVLGAPAMETVAAEMETPIEVLAVRVRDQGHVCDKPVKAERDRSASKPMAAVWLLQCSNARYRIVLHPDMAAEIEIVQ